MTIALVTYFKFNFFFLFQSTVIIIVSNQHPPYLNIPKPQSSDTVPLTHVPPNTQFLRPSDLVDEIEGESKEGWGRGTGGWSQQHPSLRLPDIPHNLSPQIHFPKPFFLQT